MPDVNNNENQILNLKLLLPVTSKDAVSAQQQIEEMASCFTESSSQQTTTSFAPYSNEYIENNLLNGELSAYMYQAVQDADEDEKIENRMDEEEGNFDDFYAQDDSQEQSDESVTYNDLDKSLQNTDLGEILEGGGHTAVLNSDGTFTVKIEEDNGDVTQNIYSEDGNIQKEIKSSETTIQDGNKKITVEEIEYNEDKDVISSTERQTITNSEGGEISSTLKTTTKTDYGYTVVTTDAKGEKTTTYLDSNGDEIEKDSQEYLQREILENSDLEGSDLRKLLDDEDIQNITKSEDGIYFVEIKDEGGDIINKTYTADGNFIGIYSNQPEQKDEIDTIDIDELDESLQKTDLYNDMKLNNASAEYSNLNDQYTVSYPDITGANVKSIYSGEGKILSTTTTSGDTVQTITYNDDGSGEYVTKQGDKIIDRGEVSTDKVITSTGLTYEDVKSSDISTDSDLYQTLETYKDYDVTIGYDSDTEEYTLEYKSDNGFTYLENYNADGVKTARTIQNNDGKAETTYGYSEDGYISNKTETVYNLNDEGNFELVSEVTMEYDNGADYASKVTENKYETTDEGVTYNYFTTITERNPEDGVDTRTLEINRQDGSSVETTVSGNKTITKTVDSQGNETTKTTLTYTSVDELSESLKDSDLYSTMVSASGSVNVTYTEEDGEYTLQTVDEDGREIVKTFDSEGNEIQEDSQEDVQEDSQEDVQEDSQEDVQQQDLQDEILNNAELDGSALQKQIEDNEGNNVETTISQNADGDYVLTSENDDGTITTSVYSTDGEKEKEIVTREADGKQTEEIYLIDEDGNLILSETNSTTYNDDGSRVNEKTEYGSDGQKSTFTQTNYSSEGKKVDESVTNYNVTEEGVSSTTTLYTYDDNEEYEKTYVVIKNYEDGTQTTSIWNGEGQSGTEFVTSDTSTDSTGADTEKNAAVDSGDSTDEAEAAASDSYYFNTSSSAYQNGKINDNGDGTYSISVDSWNADNSDNLDCVSRIIRNVYGVEYTSSEGQAIFEALAAQNPGVLDVNNPDLVNAGVTINLIDASSILSTTTSSSETNTDEKLSQMYTTALSLLETGVLEGSSNSTDLDGDGISDTFVAQTNDDGTTTTSYVLSSGDTAIAISSGTDIQDIYLMNSDGTAVTGMLATVNSQNEAYQNTQDFEGQNVLLSDYDDSTGTFASAVIFDENNNVLNRYILNTETNSYELKSDEEDEEDASDSLTSSEAVKTTSADTSSSSSSDKTETDEVSSEEAAAEVVDMLESMLNMSDNELEEIIGSISAVENTLESNSSYTPSELRKTYYKYVTALYAAAQRSNEELENTDNYQITYNSDGTVSTITLGYTKDGNYTAMVEYDTSDTSSIIVHDKTTHPNSAYDKKVVFNSDGTLNYYIEDEDGDGFDDEDRKYTY